MRTDWLATLPWLPWALLAAGVLNLVFAWHLRGLLARHSEAATGWVRAVPGLTLASGGVALVAGIALLLLR